MLEIEVNEDSVDEDEKLALKLEQKIEQLTGGQSLNFEASPAQSSD